MVKSYFRYVQEACFGVVASPGSNALVDKKGRLAVAPALESAIVWNIKTGVPLCVCKAEGATEVVCLAQSRKGKVFATGYVRVTAALVPPLD
jgi:hypothetical protein